MGNPFLFRKNLGFTLIELMVTIIIIGILASFAIPVYVRSVEQGRQAEAYQNLGAIRESTLRYYHEHFRWPKVIGDIDFSGTGSFNHDGSEYFGKYFTYYYYIDPKEEIIIAIRTSTENPGYNYNIILYFNGDYKKDGAP